MKGNIFIKRPVFAISISILIVAIGVMSLLSLPVEQYPDIAPPTVYVSASYTGADAEAVMNSVVVPLEEQINGVESMTYITSTAASGRATIQVYFERGTDPDMAAVNVQNRVSQAQGYLPSEVTQVGVTVVKRQNSFLQAPALVSTNDRYDKKFIANYLNINVVPRLNRIEGVGDVLVLSDTYSMRIWLNPARMAQYGLQPSDITAVLAEQNTEAPTGSFGENSENSFEINMRYTGRLENIGEFENIVVRANSDGSVLRLKDVARIELGTQSYSFMSGVNGHAGVPVIVFQMAGSNATEANNRLTAELEAISEDLPDGLEFVQLMNTNDFLYASIYNVVETLLIAIVLVILIVYFFLHDFKATLIPSLSIIVSMIGTFACLVAAGFSLNILTLFALVLCIGTVVDDAIVVVEAVQEKFDSGYKSSYLATRDAMGEVTMAIISCTCVFMAVFIPTTFTGGTAGVFYTQFGVTMATSVGISMISALTLCPALCALIMRPSDGRKSPKSINGRVRAAYNASFGALLGKYKKGVKFAINHRWIIWLMLIIAGGLLVYFMKTTKTGLVPQEDQGVILIDVSTSPGTTLAQTNAVMDRIEDIIQEIPEMDCYMRVAGYGLVSGQGVNNGCSIVRLKDWSERKGKEHSNSAVMARLKAELTKIKDANTLCMEMPQISGYGSGSSVELYLQDRTGGDRTAFYQQAQKYLAALNARPEISLAYTSYAPNYPQYKVEVDAAQCKRAGLSTSEVLSALGTYCGATYVNNYNQFGKLYRVMVQAAPEYRLDEQSLSNMYVRNGSEMAPLSQFVKLTKMEGTQDESRFNLYNCINVNAMVADGYSSGEGINAIDEVADQVFPQGYGYELGGISREEQQSGGSRTTIVYLVCVFLIYLILACLYESFLLPFAVILSVPFGLMGSMLFAWCFDLQNDIYLQTAMIMLIGLLSKTAILITEFAIQRRSNGMGLIESAFEAAQVRFRPIMMTALTCIFGMLPLMFSTGAGANGNSSLGTGVVGGMTVGTIALIFVVPVFYIIFQSLQEKFSNTKFIEADEPSPEELGESEAEPSLNNK